MGGPWEQYAAAPEEAGPWSQYGADESTGESEWVQKPGTKDKKVKDLEKEFIQKEGTLGTRFRNSTPMDILVGARKEAPRLVQEMLTVPINATKPVLAGLGSVADILDPRNLNNPERVAGLEDRRAARREWAEKPFVTGPMAPSVTGELISQGLGKVREGAEAVTGDSGYAGAVFDAGMNTAGLMSAVPIVKGVVKPVARVATDAALRNLENIPYVGGYLGDTALYTQALKPGTSLEAKGQAARAKAVETGLQQEAVISPTGDVRGNAKGINDVIQKTFGEGEVGGLWQQGEAFVKSPEMQRGRISVKKIEQGAKDAASELGAGNRDAARAAVEKVATELREHKSYDPKTDTISGEGAYREKQKLYKGLMKAYEKDSVVGMADAQISVADGLRKATVEIVPELADILAKEGDNLNFIKYAKRRMEKLSGEGLLGHSMGMVISAPKAILLRVLQSPGLKSRLAIEIRKAKNRAMPEAEVNATVDSIIAKVQESPEFNPETLPPVDTRAGNVEVIPGVPGRALSPAETMPGFNPNVDRSGTPVPPQPLPPDTSVPRAVTPDQAPVPYQPVSRSVTPDQAPAPYQPVNRSVTPDQAPAPYQPVSRSVTPDQAPAPYQPVNRSVTPDQAPAPYQPVERNLGPAQPKPLPVMAPDKVSGAGKVVPDSVVARFEAAVNGKAAPKILQMRAKEMGFGSVEEALAAIQTARRGGEVSGPKPIRPEGVSIKGYHGGPVGLSQLVPQENGLGGVYLSLEKFPAQQYQATLGAGGDLYTVNTTLKNPKYVPSTWRGIPKDSPRPRGSAMVDFEEAAQLRAAGHDALIGIDPLTGKMSEIVLLSEHGVPVRPKSMTPQAYREYLSKRKNK